MNVLYIIIISIDILVLFIAVVSYISFRKSFKRCDAYRKPPAGIDSPWEQHMDEIQQGSDWIREHITSEHEITSFDGLTLKAHMLENPENRGTVICVHGYRSNGFIDFSLSAPALYQKGYNLFIITQRSHYESEGKYITLGIKERFDVKQWAEYINRVADTEKPVYLLGLSMGAASVLMSSALGLPGYIKGLIADCGFDSAYNQIKYVLNKGYHLPVFPTMYIVEGIFCLVNGCSLRVPDNGQLLKDCDIPVLFAHGTADEFVPYDMGKRNYDACASEKFLVSVEGAGHAVAYLLGREQYDKTLNQFFDFCENKNA